MLATKPILPLPFMVCFIILHATGSNTLALVIIAIAIEIAFALKFAIPSTVWVKTLPNPLPTTASFERISIWLPLLSTSPSVILSVLPQVSSFIVGAPLSLRILKYLSARRSIVLYSSYSETAGAFTSANAFASTLAATCLAIASAGFFSESSFTWCSCSFSGFLYLVPAFDMALASHRLLFHKPFWLLSSLTRKPSAPFSLLTPFSQ